MIIDALTILASFLVGYSLDNLWARLVKKIPGKRKKDRHVKLILKRIRIHHNIAGYIIIILGFFYYPTIFVPFGMGMIVGHRVRDELFWFIERVDKDTKKLGKQLEKDQKSLQKKAEKETRKNQIKLKRKIQNDLKDLRKTLK